MGGGGPWVLWGDKVGGGGGRRDRCAGERGNKARGCWHCSGAANGEIRQEHRDRVKRRGKKERGILRPYEGENPRRRTSIFCDCSCVPSRVWGAATRRSRNSAPWRHPFGHPSVRPRASLRWPCNHPSEAFRLFPQVYSRGAPPGTSRREVLHRAVPPRPVLIYPLIPRTRE